MKRPAVLAAVLAPTLVLVLGACDAKDKALVKASKTPCGVLPTADAAATLPSSFPTEPGEVLYMPGSAGKTTVVHGLVTGTSTDPTSTRNSIVTALRSAGYSIDGEDAEKGKEADADFSGPNKGSISVHPFCVGHLDVTYTINGS